MALETDAEVKDIQGVQNNAGDKVPASSDDYDDAHQATNLDLDSEDSQTKTETLSPPDRAETITVLAEFETDGHVEVAFKDASGSETVRRTDTENADYGQTGGGQVFVETAVASVREVDVDLVDDSAGGTRNNVTYSITVI